MWSQKVIGQNKIKNSLHESIVEDTFSHATIIDGESGYGGLPIALNISQEILCLNRSVTGVCGTCKSCLQVEQLIHPDLHIAFPVLKKDGIERKNTTAKHFMPEWRKLVLENPYLTYNEWIRSIAKTTANGDINVAECTEIIQQLNMKSFSGNHKVQIIWIADVLGSNGNKLLKLIEEPPQGTFIILVCDDANKLLQTIRSRCRMIRLPRIEESEIARALEAVTDLDASTANQIAFLSDGNFSQALSYAFIDNNNLLDYCLNWVNLCDKADFYNLRKWATDFAKYNIEEQKAILNYYLKLMASLIYSRVIGPDAIKLTESDKAKFLAVNTFEGLDLSHIEKISQILSEMVTKTERFVSGRMVMFNGSLQIAAVLGKKNKKSSASFASK